MTGLKKPPALLPGATLAVVSPASTPQEEQVRAGMAALERMGYRTVLGRHALDRGPLYYAGRREDRLADLHAAFADPAIDGVICARGGWGSAELLPYLDRDLIRANPKAFIGYSDHTSLHVWMRREVGMVTFYGPMVAADFARVDGVDWDSWKHALEGSRAWAVEGLKVLRGGEAEGEVWGGCLSILAESLGTPFAPVAGGGILFLEDIGVKVYQWDRMLLHLRYAGMLEGVKGIVFGDLGQCVPVGEAAYLEEAILHGLGDFSGPVVMGMRCGHVNGANGTMPLGVRGRLVGGRLEILEGAVG